METSLHSPVGSADDGAQLAALWTWKHTDLLHERLDFPLELPGPEIQKWLFRQCVDEQF
jgi:hypothetical protein